MTVLRPRDADVTLLALSLADGIVGKRPTMHRVPGSGRRPVWHHGAVAHRLLRAGSDGAIRVRIFGPYGVLLGAALLVVAATEVARAIAVAPGVVWHWLLLAAVIGPVPWFVWGALRTPRTLTFRPGRDVLVASLLRSWAVPAPTVRTIELLLDHLRPAGTPDAERFVRVVLDVSGDAVLPVDMPKSFALRADDGGRPGAILAVFRLGNARLAHALVRTLLEAYPEATHDVHTIRPRTPDTAVWSLTRTFELPRGRASPFTMAGVGTLALAAGLLGLADGYESRHVRLQSAPLPYAEVRPAILALGASRPVLEGAPEPASLTVERCAREDEVWWGSDPSTRSFSAQFEIDMPDAETAQTMVDAAWDTDVARDAGLTAVAGGATGTRVTIQLWVRCLTDPPDGWSEMQDEVVTAWRRFVAHLIDEATRTG